MFDSAEELIKYCNEKNKSVARASIEKEMEDSKISYHDLMDKMNESFKVMKTAATSALDRSFNSVSGLIGGDAKRVNDYRKSGNSITDDTLLSAMAMALSTSEINASMGRIVAAPTAGASGIVPAALLSAGEKWDLSDEDIIFGLFAAAMIGEIVAKNATISGAEGGCQAECGVAAAMAAGAIVEMAGGSPEQVFHAASFSLINIMGLVCDPVGGLVEYPCLLRNASGVVNAMLSADLALAGMKSLIPFDEVVDAMYKVGKMLPEALRETALGGIATTPTGIALKKKIQNL